MASTVEGNGRIRQWHWGDAVDPLVEVLRSGGVVAIPSESSYGLAVDPGNPEAVERVYRLKTRDRGKPLLVVASGAEQLEPWVEAEAPVFAWARRLWPAPLTVVVPLRGSATAAAGGATLAAAAGGATLAAAAGGATLAVRVPAHDRLRSLLDAIGFPLTATSANTSGEPPILDPGSLVSLMKPPPPGVSDLWVVDDGVLPGGAPSTLVDWADGAPRVLRRGAFDLDDP